MSSSLLGDKLSLLAVRGDTIELELPTRFSLAPVRGRPAVYLDQNHWSSLVNTIYEPARVSPNEREVAAMLVDLTLSRRVILPMSAGHLTETCQWANTKRRYRHGLTLAKLSGGWQMLDPLSVRRLELRAPFLRTYKESHPCHAQYLRLSQTPSMRTGGRRQYLPRHFPSFHKIWRFRAKRLRQRSRPSTLCWMSTPYPLSPDRDGSNETRHSVIGYVKQQRTPSRSESRHAYLPCPTSGRK